MAGGFCWREEARVAKQSSVLVYGTNMGGYRAAYAFAKMGHPVVLLNRGSYVDEVKYQLLAQLPFDFCWICGHMPQRLFKALGSLRDCYNARLLEVSGEAGNFKVKFTKRDQVVNNFACIECDRCIEACPVQVGDQKAIYVNPEAGWENIYIIDRENCTECAKCEEVCPPQCLKLDRPEETIEEEVGAIVLALEYEPPSDEDLKDFGAGRSPSVVRNYEVGRRSLLTNFVRDSVRLASGKLPQRFGIVVTPDFNVSSQEFADPNLCVSAAYRAVRIKQVLPEAEVAIYHGDGCVMGKGHQRWFDKAQASGVRIRQADKLRIVPGDGESADIEYESAGESHTDRVDLAILITGQKPPSMMTEMEQLCGVTPDANGFCRTKPFSCCETDRAGVFAVGEFSGPKGNPETVWDGCAAVTEARKYLGPPTWKPAAPPELRSTLGEEPVVGVFICSCFGEFAKHMDLESLSDLSRKIPGVDHVEIVNGCCTPPTIKETAGRIRASGVNRVVLAVCTPLQKLLKFRNTVMMAGLNPLLSEYLRLREDVINVHKDPEKMLAKALGLIRAGVERVRRSSQAGPPTDAFGDTALVVGAGPAGLLAARELAANGFPVTLVEKEADLGGGMADLDGERRAFAEGVLAEVEASPDVAIHKGAEIARVDGYAGNFRATIRSDGADTTIAAGVILIATGGNQSSNGPDMEENRQLSEAIGHPLDRDGFFDSDASVYPYEDAMKRITKPFELTTNGIYPVGFAHSVRSFDGLLLTVRDAVGRAMVLLSKKRLPPPNAMYLAEVRDPLCVGCGTCVQVCPYSARYVDPRTKVAQVHPFLCDSCGSCVAACPSDASRLRDFTGDQALAALDAVLT
jgi:heterodisulfide reductase subunit A